MWQSVLFVPCVMLTDHSLRMEVFIAGGLARAIASVEDQLNVTRVGRERQPLNTGNDVSLPKSKAENMIISINTLFTTSVYTSRSPQWHQEVCEFLLKLGEAVSDQGSSEQSEILREVLEHHLQRAKGFVTWMDIHRSRLQLQLDVLYTMLSQTDNALNARIAVSAGRDSTSMKILALITAAFLPPSFVATLFSMGMFQWQADDSSSPSDGAGEVSSNFWIYWATAVPLTLLTLCGWGFWWNLEKRKYEKELIAALGPSTAHLQRYGTNTSITPEKARRNGNSIPKAFWRR